MKNNLPQRIPFYQVDAFSTGPFTGNPAAVCLLDAWLDDAVLQRIATENNLSETAFVVKQDDGFRLRWFTPAVEVDLCGQRSAKSGRRRRQRALLLAQRRTDGSLAGWKIHAQFSAGDPIPNCSS